MRRNKEAKTAKLLRGMRAKWLSFDGTTWTLIGKGMDTLSTNLNPDIEQSKDVTGATYTEHKGFAPESDIEYQARDDDGIYTHLQEIVDGLLKGESETAAFMIDATLTDHEVKDATGTTVVTGSGYKVPVVVVPQDEGGDTSGYTINFNCYENGARVQGTVSVTNQVPTFTAANAG